MVFYLGNKVESVGGALEEHFFGPKGTDKLTVEKFQKFHSQLITEILQMEVCMYVCICYHVIIT